jgi:hypothetical protein
MPAITRQTPISSQGLFCLKFSLNLTTSGRTFGFGFLYMSFSSRFAHKGGSYGLMASTSARWYSLEPDLYLPSNVPLDANMLDFFPGFLEGGLDRVDVETEKGEGWALALAKKRRGFEKGAPQRFSCRKRWATRCVLPMLHP